MHHISCARNVALFVVCFGCLAPALRGQRSKAPEIPADTEAVDTTTTAIRPDWHDAHHALLQAYFEHQNDPSALTPIVSPALTDPAAPNRRLALEIIARAELGDLRDAVRAALGDTNDTVRGTAALSLARLADTAARPQINALVNGTPSTSWEHRRALAALVALDDATAVERVESLLTSARPEDRVLGAYLTRVAGGPLTEPEMVDLQFDENPVTARCLCTPDGATTAPVTVGMLAGPEEAAMDVEAEPAVVDDGHMSNTGLASFRQAASMSGEGPACDTEPNDSLLDWGYLGSGAELAPDRTTMPFYVDSSYQTPPSWLLDIFLESADVWNSVSTSRYVFDYQGYSFEPDHFTSGAVRFMAGNGSGLGMPFISYYPDGNAYKTGFQVTITYGGSADISWYMHLARHELGHAQGLSHSSSTANVMVSGWSTYDLGQGDVDGSTALHPMGNRRPIARLAQPQPHTGGSPLTVTIDASDSVDPDGDIAGYTFIFGDGSPPYETTSPIVTHTYVLPSNVEQQTFTVQLMVCDTDGYVDYWTDSEYGQPVTVTVDQCGDPSTAGQDCNANGTRDDCEIQDGLADDCDGNGVPDDCQADCNANGQADACDIDAGLSTDCTGNGIPDDCEADCNGDGLADACAILQGAADCNSNGRPDDCDLEDGAVDCNDDGIPDTCQDGGANDCDLDGQSDLCALALGDAVDADGNGVPDHCDACSALGCGDDNGDGRRDAACMWWSCTFDGVVSCASAPRDHGDVGGQFGACGPDGVVDLNDWFHTLNCFANANPDGGQGYACEGAAPHALNVDIGGPFGGCEPDGICDMHDAYHVRSVLDGVASCGCGTAEASGEGGVVGETDLLLRAGHRVVSPGGLVDVEILLDGGLEDLRAFQLHLDIGGGRRGGLEIVDMALVGTPFADGWQAFNADTGQMAAGLTTPGVAVADGAVLARVTLRVSDDAFGVFYVDALHDSGRDDHRTFMMPTAVDDSVAIGATRPAVIKVRSGRRGHPGWTKR